MSKGEGGEGREARLSPGVMCVVVVGNLGWPVVRGTGGAGQPARRRGRKGERHRGRAWALLLWAAREYVSMGHSMPGIIWKLAGEWAQLSRSVAELHSTALVGGMFFVGQNSPAQSAHLAPPSTTCPWCPVSAPAQLQTLSSRHFQVVSGGRAALVRSL